MHRDVEDCFLLRQILCVANFELSLTENLVNIGRIPTSNFDYEIMRLNISVRKTPFHSLVILPNCFAYETSTR